MKVKVPEAKDTVLDWLVCIANGLKPEDIKISYFGSAGKSLYRRTRDEDGNLDGSYMTGPDLLFSRKWEAGGPIIEREGISVSHSIEGDWMGYYTIDFDMRDVSRGPTPLVAAMRCYVASRLGDEAEVPDELA